MTCKDCVNFTKCLMESEHNEYLTAKMYKIGFWENISGCNRFKPKPQVNLQQNQREDVEN